MSLFVNPLETEDIDDEIYICSSLTYYYYQMYVFQIEQSLDTPWTMVLSAGPNLYPHTSVSHPFKRCKHSQPRASQQGRQGDICKLYPTIPPGFLRLWRQCSQPLAAPTQITITDVNIPIFTLVMMINVKASTLQCLVLRHLFLGIHIVNPFVRLIHIMWLKVLETVTYITNLIVPEKIFF